MINDRMALADFGWSPFFQSQLDIELLDQTFPVRIEAIHRAAIDVIAPCLDFRIEPTEGEWQKMPSPAVGDWLLVDRLRHRPLRLLERKSIIRRKAPGGAVGVQPIAANIDTLLIVSSCNQDFNPRRLERYLTLAHQAEIQPVIVLTKADLADDVGAYGDRARALAPGDLLIECLDGRAADDVAKLAPWCGPGRTVAVVGSSGVGKSTLVNTLRGEAVAATAGIREDDARGRHTTTGRALFRLPAGGWILTPRACGKFNWSRSRPASPRCSATSCPWRRPAGSGIAITGPSPAVRCAARSRPVTWTPAGCGAFANLPPRKRTIPARLPSHGRAPVPLVG